MMSTRNPCDTPTGLLAVDDARRRVVDAIHPVEGFETLPLRSALGRVVFNPVISPVDVPPHRNSAMDGYALNSQVLPADGDQIALRVVGTAWAGIPYEGRVAPDQAVRIMTGAKVPNDCDTVLPQELVQIDGNTIHIGHGHRVGANVRHPGEDVARGETILSPGRRLQPADLGLLASLGIAEVAVRRRIRVAFFSTGDELRAPGEPLGDGQIYDSNRYTLHGMLSRLGVDLIDLGCIRDRRPDVVAAFRAAAATADAVITSGGVSVGDADYVQETLSELGEVNFWKVAMKPGKPFAFGRLDHAWFFGLPGNPVAVMATFYQLVLPALRRLAGEATSAPLTLKVPAAERLRMSPGRTDFQRGILGHDEHGELVVRSTGRQGSHVLSSMSLANCFIVLPADCTGVEPGERVEVQPFEGLF